jgi:protease-4
MNFLRSFFASVLGSLTAFGLFFAILLMIISASATIINAPSVSRSLSSNSVLSLELNLPIVERPPVFDELQQFLGLEDEVMGLPNILSAIRIAGDNPNIEGISLRADNPISGWSQAHSIRKALKEFKNKGKFIYAYGDFFTQKGYFLTSVADSVFMNPVGLMEFKGLASEVLYYKDFQNEYGFKMEVIRLGKYKSAVEPFLENEMSTDNRYQIRSLLNDIWGSFKEGVSESRNLNTVFLDSLASKNNISLPSDAYDVGLIDGITYQDDFEQKIKTRLGLEENQKLKKASINQVNANKNSYDTSIKDRIAVVFANGPILYGEGSESINAQGVFVKTLESLAQDDWVKAIVLRVNSPGGSALTSELIWRAIENAKQSKPVIASMGNVAASGGYYISTGADYIFADPMTITGSIGVFATLPNAAAFVKDIGISPQTVTTHPNAMGYSLYQPLSQNFEQQLKKGVQFTYDTFKNRVMQGRSLSVEAVENLAQGRVWTGKQALENGLVDALGDLEDAIAMASEKANIESYNVLEYPKFEENLENILKGVTPSLELKSPWTDLIPKQLLKQFKNSTELNPTFLYQTLLPFELRIY